MSDLISRKMAIEAFEPTHYIDWYTPIIIETLEALPSVQPEVLACGSGELVQESGDLVKDLVKDCISRQAAMVVFENSGLDDDSKDTVVRVLEQLPSAQPEIIRCKECIYFDKYIDCKEMYQWDGFCAVWARKTYENWYCSRAERRSDG